MKNIYLNTIIISLLIFFFGGTYAISQNTLQVDSANYLASKGIIGNHSYDPENYKLEQNVLRQEIAAVARGVAGLSKKSKCNNIFSDLSSTKPNSWACINVEVLVNNNLISRNSTFRPEDYITKSEALGMIIKAGGYNYEYSNSLGTTWQTQIVNYAVEKGIISRFYDYNSNATRGWVFEVAYSIEKEKGNTDKTEEQNIINSSYDSPFGLLDAMAMDVKLMLASGMGIDGYFSWEARNIEETNIEYGRKTNLLMWDWHEPDLGEGYIWTSEEKGFSTDDVLKNIYNYVDNSFNMVLSIKAARNKDVSFLGTDPDMENKYQDFIKAAVERYNGDGVDDINSKVKVKYWQVDNEPFIFNAWIDKKNGTVEGYARNVELVYEAVKSVDNEAKVVLGAAMTPSTGAEVVDDNIRNVIELLKDKKVFDIVDIHYWGLADNYKMDIAKDMRKLLDENGYSYVEIWSCEHGTHTNEPNGLPYQSESQQAVSLIKRYVYNLANDLDKIFWTKFVDFSCYGGNQGKTCGSVWDNIGLISDGANSEETEETAGVKRLAYYSHVILANKLNNVDWNNIEIIFEGDNGIYAYKFSNGVYIVWTDNNSETLSLSEIGLIGEVEVTESVPNEENGLNIDENNYLNSFKSYSVSDQIELGDIPVFIQKNSN